MPLTGDRSDPTGRTRKKNSSLIVPATAAHLRGAPMVDVTTLDALVEIAKKYETVIIELPAHDGHEYLLWDDGMVFRFHDADEDPSTPLEQLRGTPDDAP